MRKTLGVGSIVAAAAFYGSYGVFSRLISPVFNTFSQNYVRESFTLVFILISLLVSKDKWKKLKKKDIKWMSGWAICGSLNMLFLFQAFNNLPIGTTYFLFYSTMIISGYLFGNILFKEKFTLTKVVSLGLTLLGVKYILGNTFTVQNSIYIIYALLAGVSIGLYNVFSKKVSSNYSPNQILLYSTAMAMIVGILGSILFGENIPLPSSHNAWFWIIAYSITTFAANYFLILGFKYLEAQIASLFLPIEAVFAAIFGYLIYQENLSQSILVGGMLIISSALLPDIVSLTKTKNLRTLFHQINH